METLGFLASFIMGIVLGLMGGGGSILTVPILVYLFGISPTEATGNSLLVVGCTALIGSVAYIRRGEVELKVGIAFALPSVAGVLMARAWIVRKLPDVILNAGPLVLTKDVLLMVTFAALMVFASYSMIRRKSSAPPTQTMRSITQILMISAQGFLVGIVAGFVGAGGGFLIVPAFVFMAGLSMRSAVGTSLLVIAFQSLIGFSVDALSREWVDWKLLVWISIMAAGGILLGSKFAHRVPEARLKKMFGWFVLVLGTVILIQQVLEISGR